MDSSDWKQHLDEDPSDELLRFSYAKALMDEKHWALAAVQFDLLTQNNPEYAISWAFLAKCRLRSGDRDGARLACENGLPVTRRQKHETPEEEMRAVLEELDSEF